MQLSLTAVVARIEETFLLPLQPPAPFHYKSNGVVPFKLTAQMHTTAKRLNEVDAADLTFVIRRDDLVVDLVLACADRIEQVTARKGRKKTIKIGKLWEIKNKKSAPRNAGIGMD